MVKIKEKKIQKVLKKHVDEKTALQYAEEIEKYDFKYKKNCFIAIILQESKNALVTYIPNKVGIFNIANNNYINLAQGKYLNNKMHITVYMEGVMIPIEHNFIQYESVYTLYYDEEGKPVNHIDDVRTEDLSLLMRDHKGELITNSEGFFVIDVSENIKGFEFDSKTANVLFESSLTHDMSMDKSNKALPILTVMSFILLLCIIVDIAINFL